MVRGYLLDILDKNIYNAAETPPGFFGGVLAQIMRIAF